MSSSQNKTPVSYGRLMRQVTVAQQLLDRTTHEVVKLFEMEKSLRKRDIAAAEPLMEAMEAIVAFQAQMLTSRTKKFATSDGVPISYSARPFPHRPPGVWTAKADTKLRTLLSFRNIVLASGKPYDMGCVVCKADLNFSLGELYQRWLHYAQQGREDATTRGATARHHYQHHHQHRDTKATTTEKTEDVRPHSAATNPSNDDNNDADANDSDDDADDDGTSAAAIIEEEESSTRAFYARLDHFPLEPLRQRHHYRGLRHSSGGCLLQPVAYDASVPGTRARVAE
ncbi:hypothetical protein GGR56DRAFT_637257 [Xylariaceae sp. FL0804]|nr:hypothetical protein GGR56DRAFT_637257 [Xylariaceae sp. FL0804]